MFGDLQLETAVSVVAGVDDPGDARVRAGIIDPGYNRRQRETLNGKL